MISNDVYYFLLSYLGVIVLVVGLFAWWMQGALGPYVRVKLGRGKLALVKIRGTFQDYFRPAKVADGFVIFKDRMKQTRRVAVTKMCSYRMMGVNCFDLDEEKNAVITRDFEIIGGFDAVKFENLHVRALQLPKLGNTEQKIFLILLCVIIVIALAGAFLSWDAGAAGKLCVQTVGNMTRVAQV